MSDSDRQGQQSAKTATRLDSAHVAHEGQAVSPTELPAGGSALPALLLVETTSSPTDLPGGPALAEQLQKQADELAERLQRRHQLLDRRESELNARTAAVETQSRSTDLRLAERQELIAAQLEQTAHHRELLEQRLAEFGIEPGSEIALPGELEATMVRARETRAAADESDGPRPPEQTDGDENSNGSAPEAASGSQAELESRHRELDQRQAQLYQDIEDLTAQRAQLTMQRDEAETLRKELDTGRTALTSERERVERESSELSKNSADFESRQIDLDARTTESEDRCRDLDQREHQLGLRTKEIESALKRFKRLGVTEQRIRTAEQQAEETEARNRYLDDAEAMFADQQVEFDRERQQLQCDRRQFERQQRRDREAFETGRNQHDAEVRRQTQQLDHRRDGLDSRDTALAQLQAELGASQKDVLEMRLAAEEVWARLAGALAPAALSQSIAQVRAQLGEHYRLANAELSARLDELRQASAQLVEQRETLLNQKTELENWADRRREEMERQAARLIAREQELNRQHAFYEDLQGKWEAERAGLRREIQQLLAELRKREQAAA